MILDRARHCCEKCGVSNYAIVTKEDRELIWENDSYSDAKKALAHCHPSDQTSGFIIIVLTVAHKDHFPMNCDPANLLALCQKCHNRMDAKHRAKTRQKKRREALELSAPSLPLVTSIISKL
jgi:5-methylcytosine-specific restriction endonuclease McrA